MDKAAPSVDHLTRSLLKLSDAQDAAAVSEVTSQIGNLRDSIQQLSDPGIESDLLGAYDKVPLIGGAFADYASKLGSTVARSTTSARAPARPPPSSAPSTRPSPAWWPAGRPTSPRRPSTSSPRPTA
jgi:hypothetical protein